MNNGHDQILFRLNDRQRIYLCEYGLIHVEWNQHRLLYCPGDLIGLPFLLEAIHKTCQMECLHENNCPHETGEGKIYLPYGSVQILLSEEECRSLYIATQKAAQRLHQLRAQGYFSNQNWLPTKEKQQKFQQAEGQNKTYSSVNI